MKCLIVLSALVFAVQGFAAPAKKAPTTVESVTTTTTTQSPVIGDAVAAAPLEAVGSSPTITNSSTTEIQAPSEGKITGTIEARPTVSVKGPNDITTENTIGLGYKFNPNLELGAVQYFDTNVKANTSNRQGVDGILQDGFIRAKFNNVYKSESVTFGYEPRIYAPTRTAFRDAGGLTMVRNYLKLAYKASNSVTLTAMEIPILQFYNKAGVGTTANPAFENRVYLMADFDLGQGFAFSLPLFFHQTKLRTYSAAANSGQWDFFVYTWPELTYAVTENVTVGVAYQSGNLMTSSMGGFTFSDGLKKGAFQAIVGVTL